MNTSKIIIAIDLSRQKQLHGDPKAIQQIEFVTQLKNPDYAIFANESMFLLMVFRKNQTNKTKVSLRKSNSLIINGELWRSKS